MELEVYGETAAMDAVARHLDQAEGVSRVHLVAATRTGRSLVRAAVRPRRADATLAELRGMGVPDADVTLARPDIVGRAVAGPDLVWEDILGMAWVNAQPVARYFAFMAVAGVIGGYGVVDRNAILIVGAMAVSPDLLPITAIGVSVVGRRARLAGYALATLVLGMAVASGGAAVSTFAQSTAGLIPAEFSLGATGLGNLNAVNDETIVVALVAGVAAMLALETRAGAGVGVAISVTTIPAAAYLGVAVGLGHAADAAGAVAVLAVNVCMLIVSSSATLAVQRRLGRRSPAAEPDQAC
jgi:uncharacterized hydrophobic protein (TIGR00271 family)